MLFDKKKKDVKEESINDVYVEKLLGDLKDVYTNKSTDEYKSKGDITKSQTMKTSNTSSLSFQPLRVIRRMILRLSRGALMYFIDPLLKSRSQNTWLNLMRKT